MVKAFYFIPVVLGLSSSPIQLKDRVAEILRRLEADGDDKAAEEALLVERSKDSRRPDMPSALRDGFASLFEHRRNNGDITASVAGSPEIKINHPRPTTSLVGRVFIFLN